MAEIITKEEFNELVNGGFTYETINSFSEKVIMRAVEQMLVTLPSIIHNLIGSAALMKGVSEKFYKEHQDLVDHKLLVAQAIEAIQSNNPGLKVEELLKRAVPMVRRQIITANNVNSDITNLSLAQIDQNLGNI